MAQGSVNSKNIVLQLSATQPSQSITAIDAVNKSDIESIVREEMIELIKKEIASNIEKEIKDRSAIINEELKPLSDELDSKKDRNAKYADNLAIKAAFRAEKRRDMNLTFEQFLDQLEIDIASL